MNLPDDWSSYYSTCETCGERRHASGDTECACDRGETPVDEDDAAIERERALIAAAPSLALAVEELERERDEAIAELAVERGDARFALPGWRRDGRSEWSTESGGLVRHEGATDEHGCALWSWYADEADEGDPSQTAPTARAAMRAADAAAKARQS